MSRRPTTGHHIAHYRLEGRVNPSSMATVWRAFDLRRDRPVALKLVPRGLAVPPAHPLRSFRHPHVVPIEDVGQHGPHDFMVMPWVPGPPMALWLNEARAPAQVLQVFLQAGEGLAAAHEAGIIHGDFKPDNVLVEGEGCARVLDFAGHNAARPPPCTPNYLAPERLYGAPPHPHSDQFAFCVALYEALCGNRPFGARAERLCGQVRAPPRGACDPRMSAAILRGLHPNPTERHPSLRALLSELGAARGANERDLE